MINGVTRLYMMKADVLSGFGTINVCTSYMVDGREQHMLQFSDHNRARPVYTELEGWSDDISGIREYNALPPALRHYVEFIENQTGIPVELVSVGPDRNETIFR
jgi:adenylosuccinate synthase